MHEGLGTSSQSMRDMWHEWEAVVMRTRVSNDTGALGSIVNHGVWPVDFFKSPAYLTWLGSAYLALLILWLIYRDTARRMHVISAVGRAFKMTWNGAWLIFSAACSFHVTGAAIRNVLRSPQFGWHEGICVSLDVALINNRRSMLALLCFAMIRPLKLYEILFAETKGKTESKRLLAYHLLTPLATWTMALFMNNTVVLLAWAALVCASDFFLHGYFLLQDTLAARGYRPTLAMKALVFPTQLLFPLGGFCIHAIGSDCDGNFKGNSRIFVLLVTVFQLFMSIRDMNERLFDDIYPVDTSRLKLVPRRKKGRRK